MRVQHAQLGHIMNDGIQKDQTQLTLLRCRKQKQCTACDACTRPHQGVGSPPKPPLGLTHRSSPPLASHQFLESKNPGQSQLFLQNYYCNCSIVVLRLLLLGCMSDTVVVKKVRKPRLRLDFEASSWKSSLISSYKEKRYSRILRRGVIWPHLYFRKKTMACCRSLGL